MNTAHQVEQCVGLVYTSQFILLALTRAVSFHLVAEVAVVRADPMRRTLKYMNRNVQESDSGIMTSLHEGVMIITLIKMVCGHLH